MRYQVYHAAALFQMLLPDPLNWLVDRSGYRHVADVECRPEEQPLDAVFSQTNHSEGDWTTNPAVVWINADLLPLRSTSVGDVIVDVESSQAWMIMPRGFTRILPRHSSPEQDARSH